MNKNILVITYWSYKEGLIQTYTLPYLKIISKHLRPEQKIFLVTFEKDNLKLNGEERTKAVGKLKQNNIYWMPFQYGKPGLGTYFTLALNFLRLFVTLFKNQISHIHTFCTPPGALGYLLSIFSGRKLILDSFEPHADNMEEIGHWDKSGLKYKVLHWLENRQLRRAEYVICTTQGMYQYAKDTYHYEIPSQSSFVKPACVNLDLFYPISIEERQEKRKALNLEGKVVAVYAGKLGGIYYDIEVFELLKTAYDFWEGNFVFLMLTNTPREDIDAFAKKVGLDPAIIISKFVSHHEVADYLSLGDFGITPVKSVPTKRYCTPIKDGEYWALGLPIIITPNISDDSEIVHEYDIGSVIPSLDKRGYLAAIRKINVLLNGPKEEIQQKIRKVAVQYRSFEIAEHIYKTIYGDSQKKSFLEDIPLEPQTVSSN